MQVFSGIGQLGRSPLRSEPFVAAIGVFDGVHRGHCEVIRHAVEEARRAGSKCLVITFHPHPVQVLHPQRFLGYLSTLSQRLEWIAALGVDACLVIRFTKSFAGLEPLAFVRKYLTGSLRVNKVVVGNDFHFGQDREGTLRLLAEQGHSLGFNVHHRAIKKYKHINIKSSLIRHNIKNGDIGLAAVLLGRNYRLRGSVVHGAAKGRKLGFPTANLRQENAVIPPPGIYVARVFMKGSGHNALLYIGTRPSFKRRRPQLSIEAYILDYKGDLYGREIDVEILKRIRGDRCFSDENGLISQMQKDELFARKFFAARVAKRS